MLSRRICSDGFQVNVDCKRSEGGEEGKEVTHGLASCLHTVSSIAEDRASELESKVIPLMTESTIISSSY